MQEQQSRKRGFAAISPERMRAIASAGGIARKRAFDLARGRSKNAQTAPGQTVLQQQMAGNNGTQ